MTEADILRHNVARYLAPRYLVEPAEVARLCDEEIDQSGRLLGMVREKAREMMASDNQQSGERSK